MKRMLFIYNPMAGQGKVRSRVSNIVDIFSEAGFSVTVYPTKAAHDAERLVEAEAGLYDRIAVCGGDGTLDEVITGVMKAGRRVPIGYLPAGSTNDFGTSLGISRDLLKSASIAAAGKPLPIDIGSFASDYFTYVAAFGLFTKIAYATPQEKKNFLGYAAYLIEAWKELADLPAYHLRAEYDGQVIDDSFAYGMITNSTHVAGMKGIIPGDISVNDGLFEVNLVRCPKNPAEITEAVAYLTGTIPESSLVYTIEAADITFISEEPVSWTLDGEFGGEYREVRIRNLHNSLSIMVKDDEK